MNYSWSSQLSLHCSDKSLRLMHRHSSHFPKTACIQFALGDLHRKKKRINAENLISMAQHRELSTTNRQKISFIATTNRQTWPTRALSMPHLISERQKDFFLFIISYLTCFFFQFIEQINQETNDTIFVFKQAKQRGARDTLVYEMRLTDSLTGRAT